MIRMKWASARPWKELYEVSDGSISRQMLKNWVSDVAVRTVEWVNAGWSWLGSDNAMQILRCQSQVTNTPKTISALALADVWQVSPPARRWRSGDSLTGLPHQTTCRHHVSGRTNLLKLSVPQGIRRMYAEHSLLQHHYLGPQYLSWFSLNC